MVTTHDLQIRGYRGEPVPHTYFRQEQEAYRLAALLPGMGYAAHMPLLYYPMRAALALGMDVLRVEYAYNRRPDYRELPPQEQQRWLSADVTAAFHAALAQRAYREVTLIGKSLGTLAMGDLLSAETPPPRLHAIWLTPLLWSETLRSQIKAAQPRSLFAAGTADPHYNAAFMDELVPATGAAQVLVEGANHSLEVEGDVMASLEALQRVMRAIQSFLRPVQPGATAE